MAAAATTAATAATTTAAATTAAAGAGVHGVVDNESYLAAEVLDVVDGGLFQEWGAVRIHEEFNATDVEHGVVGLALLLHGQHVLHSATLGGHGNDPQGPLFFSLFLHDFLEFLDR